MQRTGNGPTAANKHQLRATIRNGRLARDPAVNAREAVARDAAVLGHLETIDAGTVCLYVSRPLEPETANLRAALSTRGVRILLPVLHPDASLHFALDDGVLRPGLFGLREPSGPAVDERSADVIFVPALAVDRFRTRLGQGGGSYDRALASLRGIVPICAVVHPEELIEHIPAEPHDVPVDAVALPDGVRLLR